MTRHLFTLAIVFSILATTIAADSTTDPEGAGGLTEAVTAPKEDRELSFTVPGGGKVEEVLVKEGDIVKKGQVLMKLEAKEQEARIKQLEHQLINSGKTIEAARKTSELAGLEADRYKTAFEKNAGSRFEYDRAKLQHELKAIEVELEEENKKQVELEIDRNKASLETYNLRAPIDGRIEMMTVSEGESVQPLRPIVRLVDTNPLEVKADVDTHYALRLKKGDKAWITSTLPGFTKPMEGTVTFTASVASVASETLRITIEVPNAIDLKAGLTVKVTFDDPSQVASADATEANE